MRTKRYHARRNGLRCGPTAAKSGVVAAAAVAVGVGTAIGAMAVGRLFRVAVEGESMAPAFEPGDYLVALSRGRVRLGTVVVVERPDRPGLEMVKRVAGTPGDRAGPGILGPDQYWVLGDHRAVSTDSRTFGPVTAGHVRGVVIFRYWPLGRIGVPQRSWSHRPPRGD